MKTLSIILITLLLSSCFVNRFADKMEASHYHLYNDTRALFIVKRDRINLTCVSPTGLKFYAITDYYNRTKDSDTIDLRYGLNNWVWDNIKFMDPLPQQYRVEWFMNDNPEIVGNGSWSENYWLIEEWVKYANRKYPGITHYVAVKYKFLNH
jgi:hypothetical protein